MMTDKSLPHDTCFTGAEAVSDSARTESPLVHPHTYSAPDSVGRTREETGTRIVGRIGENRDNSTKET